MNLLFRFKFASEICIIRQRWRKRAAQELEIFKIIIFCKLEVFKSSEFFRKFYFLSYKILKKWTIKFSPNKLKTNQIVSQQIVERIVVAEGDAVEFRIEQTNVLVDVRQG